MRVPGTEVLRADLEASPDNRNILSWLLRKHFERHLARFKTHGLILEEDRKRKRAYLLQGKMARHASTCTTRCAAEGFLVRLLTLRARSPAPVLKVKASVTKSLNSTAYGRCGSSRFTCSQAVMRKSRYRHLRARPDQQGCMKLDRNKNVEDDLTFWSRFSERKQADNQHRNEMSMI